MNSTSYERNSRIGLPKRTVTAIHIADGQKPFHDRRCWRLILQFIRKRKPDLIINHGDDAECYHWSRYIRSRLEKPVGMRRGWTADAEIQAVQRSWDELHDAAPKKTRFIYTLGNHEARVRLCKRRTDPDSELAQDNFVDLFDAHHWWNDICEWGYGFKIGDLWVTHGTTTTKYAARSMLERWGTCVAFGHTHRLQLWLESPKGNRPRAAWSIPCHCRLDPHYVTKPGWVHGFGYSQFMPSGRFSIQAIPVIDYSFVFGGTAHQG